MTDMVNLPPHYRGHASGIECIDVTRHLTFDVGNAVKYVWRAEAKNGREDLEKARWYLRDAIEHKDIVQHTLDRKFLLHTVVESETDPNRASFFLSVFRGDLDSALNAVNAMIDAD